VFAAQSAHEHLLDTATGLRRCDRITRASDLRVDRARHAVYIDDVVQFGTDAAELARLQRGYVAAVVARRFPVKARKVVAPSSEGVVALGFEVHGRELTVGVAPAKLHDLVAATRSLLRRGQCTGRELAHVLGKWTWAMLAQRFALSAFHNAYRFAREADRKTFVIWRSVARELRVAVRLAPLLFARLATPLFAHVLACDASLAGQGVCAAVVPDADAARAAAHCGLRGPLGALAGLAASRSSPSPPPPAVLPPSPSSPPSSVASATPSNSDPSSPTAAVRSALCSGAVREEGARVCCHCHRRRCRGADFGVGACPRAFERLPARERSAALADVAWRLLVEPPPPRPSPPPLEPSPEIDGPLLAARWRVIVAAPWREEEHINSLELRAASTALRWALSSPASVGRRVLLLSDSQVAVGALSKGRTSSPPLLRRLRAVAALVLASGVQLRVRWIPSAANPADEPSRRFVRRSVDRS